MDPELRGASCERMAMGLPKMISGNFAAVFPLTSTAGNRYAVKCFTRTAPSQMERYRAIGACLGKIQPRWATGFEYIPNGIKVEAYSYPILRMDWVSGLTLGNWIVRNCGSAEAIKNIGRLFDDLIADLDAAGIAHGDLQSGNLIVTDAGTLCLVDYDGMYVPGLGGLPPGEVGHPDYQRRERSQADYGPSMDRFSAWLISLSLKIIAAEPTMLERLNPSRDEYLLLNRQDFFDLRSSSRFAIMSSSRNAEVRRLANIAGDVLSLPLSAMPALAVPTASDVHAGSIPPPSNASAIPRWMKSHISFAPTAGAPGMSPERQTPQSDSSPTRMACWLTRFAVILLIAGIVSSALSLTLVLGIGAPISMALLGWQYHQDALTREYTGLRRARRRAAAATRVRGKDVKKCRKSMSKIEDAERSLARGLEKRQATIRKDFERRRSEVSRKLMAVERKLDSLDKQRQRELGRRLAVIQQRFVQNYLSNARLDSSRIPGIGPQLVAKMRAAGIGSAGEFTGVSYVRGGRFVTAYFQRSHGGRVHVPGIGQVKAQRLEQWRQVQVSNAHRLQPKTLPVDEVRAVEASFSSSISGLEAQRSQVAGTVSVELEALQSELDKALASAVDEHQVNIRALEPRKSEAGALLGQAQVGYHAANQEVLDLDARMTAYRSWRFGRFIGTAIRGSRSS
ncbi:MAG TPA: hypothetical protein VH589_15360 [Trebonia sp.]